MDTATRFFGGRNVPAPKIFCKIPHVTGRGGCKTPIILVQDLLEGQPEPRTDTVDPDNSDRAIARAGAFKWG